jgi:hypothetical protein
MVLIGCGDNLVAARADANAQDAPGDAPDPDAPTADCPAAGSAVNEGCSNAAATSCGANKHLLTCAAVSVGTLTCNVWQDTADCAGEGLACDDSSATAACACPANRLSDFYANPIVDRNVPVRPTPNGLAAPALCSYATVSDAVAAANTAIAGGAPSARAIATGSTLGMSAVFGAETFPLAIDAGSR